MSQILSKHSSSTKTKKPEPLSIEERLAKLEEDKKLLLKEKREQKKLKAKRALDEMRLNRISWEKELCVALHDFFPDTPSELAKLLRRAEAEIQIHTPLKESAEPVNNTKNGESL